MGPFGRFPTTYLRPTGKQKPRQRRGTLGFRPTLESLEERTVLTGGSPITTLGAATILESILPPTNQDGGQNGQGVPYGANYETPYAAQPNVTSYFTSSGLPIQSTDWWSSVMFRTVGASSGYSANAAYQLTDGTTTYTNVTVNNLSYPLFVDPLILQVDSASTVSGSTTTYNPRGLAIGYAGTFVNTGVNAPGQNTDAIVTASFNQDLLVGLVDSTSSPISSAHIAIDNYSDWGATFAWSNGQSGSLAASISATAANGSPYVFFTTAGGSEVRISLSGQSAGPSLAYLSANSRVAVVVVPNGAGGAVTSNNVYALFAPEGGAWVYTEANGSTPAMLTMSLTGANAIASYFSAAVLPSSIVNQTIDSSNVLLETFRQHAYAFILGPQATRESAFATTPGTQVVDTLYTSSTSSVTTILGINTRLMDTSDATLVNGALTALYAHQFKNLGSIGNIDPLQDPSGSQYTYNSGKGTMRLFGATDVGQAHQTQSTTFSTRMDYKGILPYLPNALTSTDAATRDQLIAYVHDVATGLADTKGLPFPGISENVNFISIDTNYPAGKHMLRVGLVLPIIDQLLAITTDPTNVAQLTEDRITLLAQVQSAMAEFFDVAGYQWLAYNEDWDTLIPYPDDNGTATNLNDKHFKWGYFLRAAALIARYNPDFISPMNFGPILNLIARDAGNWDRAPDGQFTLPFLRNFNPYAGHSWANGDAVGGNGNNQESSAEAINFAVGMIQFGEAYSTFDAVLGETIRDWGIYLFTTETEAIEQYYFNVDQDNYPEDFTLNYATVQTQSPVTAADTQITIAGSSIPAGFPQGASDVYRVRLDNETMLVTSRAGNVLTVLRGYDGSIAAAHAADVGVSLLDPFTTLGQAVSASDTSLAVTSSVGFPPAPANGATAIQFNIKIDSEILTVTGGAGTTTWTILRGQDGTTAQSHAIGASAILYGQVAPWGNLSSSVASTDSTISMAASTTLGAFPDPSTAPFQIDFGSERMLVTGQVNATTWSVLRGQGGTQAVVHATGERFQLVTRDFAWSPPQTTVTTTMDAQANSIVVDAASSTFGGFGNVPNVVTTTAISGQLLSFTTTLAQAISDTVDAVINITVNDASPSITAGQFFITVGTGGNQSYYFVQNVLSAPYTTWNVKRLGSSPYTSYSAGETVSVVWPSGTSISDLTDQPTLILDSSTLPTIASALAPFTVSVGSDTYTVNAILGEANNIWQIGASLANTYASGTDVYSAISSSSTVIAVTSTAGFPTAGAFRILIDNEVMLVQGRYFDTQTHQYLANLWNVQRGYDGTQAVAHSNVNGVAIHWINPETSFTVQVDQERMRVLGQSAPNTWTVLRGADGTTPASHNLGAFVSLAGIAPITRVDITGRLFGSGPQKTTFFATPALDREAAFRVIQSLPITGASLYLGQYRNADGTSTAQSEARMLAEFEQWLINAQVYPGQVNGGGLYPGTIWGYQALADAAFALGNFDDFITDNYAYNVLVGTLAAQAVTAGANSVLVAPSNGVFVIPPDHNSILAYFKVAFGDASSTDTLLIRQMQLAADAYGNTLFTGTRSNGVHQPLGQNVVPAAFTPSEIGTVTTVGSLAWGTSTVTITDGAGNPFPFQAPVGTAENVRFWVQVPVLVNGQTVTETWQVNQQTRNADNTRTWSVTRQLVPLSTDVNLAAPSIAAGTAITPISSFLKINANSGLDEGESAANTFNIISQLVKLGEPEGGVVAVGATQYAVFRDANAHRSYAIYNNSSAVLPTVNFYAIEPDGALSGTALHTFTNVAARSLVWYSEATGLTTTEAIPSLTTPTSANEFFLLNTQGNNPTNLANDMSSGADANPGGDRTNLLTLPATGTGDATFVGGVSFVIDNVSGTYDSTQNNTRFRLFTVSGSTESYSSTQPELLETLTAALPTGAAYSTVVRVSYYSTSDTGPGAQPFRVELFQPSTHNNPSVSSATNTFDEYTDAVGLQSSSGSFVNMTGGSVKVEAWLWSINSSGAQNVGLKVSTPVDLDPKASHIVIPYSNVSTTGPGISGTVALQPIADHWLAKPFTTVTVTNPTAPGNAVHAIVEIVNPRFGSFTAKSLAASGFHGPSQVLGSQLHLATSSGTLYTLFGTAAQVTAALRQLVFQPARSMGTVGSTRVISFRLSISQDGGVSVTDNSTSLHARNAVPSNASFVQSLYVDLLGRNADSKGLRYWTQRLARGATRYSVVQRFWSTPEHRALQVESYYSDLLGRQPNPTERTVWVRRLQKGVREELVISSLLSSREFRGQFRNNSQYIDALYRVLLGRPSTAWNRVHGLVQFRRGVQPSTYIQRLLLSPSYRQREISRLCVDWLGRQPIPSERALLFQQFGQSPFGIAGASKALLVSNAYFQHS